MAQHFEHRLPNGLTILAETTPTARSFAAGLFVKTGSRDETGEINGVSHFLEHMMFKGSDVLDAEAMNRVFDDMGANYNAFTSQETTAYYAQVLPEFAADAMAHLGQLFRPALRQGDFDTEKQVILEEIAMYLDDPNHRLYERTMAEHFGRHPLAMSILGPAETIEALPRDAMMAYLKAHYGPKNTVLAVTGQFDFDRVVALAEEHYGHWEPVGFARQYDEPAAGETRVDLTDAKLNRRYLMGLSPGPSAQDDARYAANLLGDIVGDGENGRLYWALVDNALCDEADFSPYPHDRTGSFALSLVTEPDRGDEALEIAKKELLRVRDDLEEAEVERAKNKVAGSATLHGESPLGRMRAIGGGWVYHGEYRPLDAELDAILAVTKQDVLNVIERFPLAPTTVVTIGP